MKAVHLTGYGPTADLIEVREIAEPGAPGPGEALVAVEYAPINYNDLMILWGIFPWRPETPAIIGSEGGGIVTAVGEGVTSVKPGDRVVLPLVSGTWRERLVVAADALAVVPPEADPQQAAMLGINATTAALLLDEYVALKPGDAVVYNAANSGVARWIAALAKEKGLRTVGLIRRASDIDAVKPAGCDFVVTDDEPLADVQARLSDLPIRLGLDVIGGAASGRVASIVSSGGKLVNFGSIAKVPMELSGFDLSFRQVSVEGFFVGFPEQAAKAYARLADLGAMLAAKRIVQPVTATFPIAQARKAVDFALRNGRVLLSMGDK